MENQKKLTKKEYSDKYIMDKYNNDPEYKKKWLEKNKAYYQKTKEKARERYINKKKKEYIEQNGSLDGWTEPRKNDKTNLI